MRNAKSWPRISIVTPSFNQGRYIEGTIRSVLLQGYPNLEYILIDGGSNDGSLEIIRKYEPWLAYWVSEKDRGQADALEKGFNKARGELFGWINSDDLLAPSALRVVAEAHTNNPHLGIYAGIVQNFDESGQIREVVRQREISFLNLLLPLYETRPNWHQPGIFFTSELYRKSGGINPKYFYRMDYDLLLRMLDAGGTVSYIDKALAYFQVHGLSKTGRLTYAFVEGLMKETYEAASPFIAKLPPDYREKFRIQYVDNLLHAAFFGLVSARPMAAANCLSQAARRGRLSFYRALLGIIARGLLGRIRGLL